MIPTARGRRTAGGAEREAGREHPEIRSGDGSFVWVPERRLGFLVLGGLIEVLVTV
jgi:hypothetical protein